MKYKVILKSRYNGPESDGNWHDDDLSNNGQGFTFDEAIYVAHQLAAGSIAEIKDIQIVLKEEVTA